MKKNILNKKKLKFLNCAIKHVPFEGWNDGIFSTIAKDFKIKTQDVSSLFSGKYLELLKFYLEKNELEMITNSKKLNLNNLKTHEKIYEIIIQRFEKNYRNKELIRKTLIALSLPQNLKLGISSLFKTIDNIWYLTGDKSTDFNFYTKRMILAPIYSSSLLFWIKDGSKDSENTKKFLIKKLKNTSIIKKIKYSITDICNKIPNFVN